MCITTNGSSSKRHPILLAMLWLVADEISRPHCKKSWVFFALKNWVFFTPKNWAKFLGILVWTPKHGISEITKANYIWYMLKLPNSLNVGKVIFTRIYCKKSWVFFALKNWVFFTPKNWAKFLGILVWTPKHGISEITKANYIWYMLKLPNSLNVGKVIFTRIYTRWSSQIYLS